MRLSKLGVAAMAAGSLMALAVQAQAQSIDLRSGYYAARDATPAPSCNCFAGGPPTPQAAGGEHWEYREMHQYDADHYAQQGGYGGNYGAYTGPAPQQAQQNNYPYYYDQYTPGQSNWRPQLLLPPNLRGYMVTGYVKGLGRPKAGYAWYHVGNEYLLASTATGVIVTIMTFPN